VLPSNGLTDLINILGNRVAAALPPSLSPGDLFSAQVTGFNGTQILLQVLNTLEPGQASAPPPLSNVPLPALPDEPLSALAEAATRPIMPDGVSPSMAPPPAVFVAASVRPAPGLADGTAPAPPPSSQVIQPAQVILGDIEARLAAARAGAISINVPAPGGPAPANAPAAGSAAPAPPLASPRLPINLPVAPPQLSAGAPPATTPVRFQIPPVILPSARLRGPTSGAPAGSAAPAENAAPVPTGLASYRSDPAALARALNLPVTPTNIASARLALDTPQRLPAALATLESALPEGDDPRVATLRTLTTWLGKIEPSSPELASQISAFVDHVVGGNEPKLAQLLSAQLAAADEPEAAPQPAAANAANTGAAPPAPVPAATLPVVALAQIAERGAAVAFDLKTQLFSVINAPPAGAEEAGELVPAASSALTAITAVQMNAAQAMNASPQTMAFTVPMWLGSSYAQARIAIDRDAPEQDGSRALDGSNFHIAFVLDTKHLGTVTVDLQTVGRAFSLAVKAESELSAKRFGESLDRLTNRLETLRYRVNSAEATVAARGSAATAATAPAAPDSEDDGGIASDVNVRA
jgi:hypothetical protein